MGLGCCGLNLGFGVEYRLVRPTRKSTSTLEVALPHAARFYQTGLFYPETPTPHPQPPKPKAQTRKLNPYLQSLGFGFDGEYRLVRLENSPAGGLGFKFGFRGWAVEVWVLEFRILGFGVEKTGLAESNSARQCGLYGRGCRKGDAGSRRNTQASKQATNQLTESPTE